MVKCFRAQFPNFGFYDELALKWATSGYGLGYRRMIFVACSLPSKSLDSTKYNKHISFINNQ